MHHVVTKKTVTVNFTHFLKGLLFLLHICTDSYCDIYNPVFLPKTSYIILCTY